MQCGRVEGLWKQAQLLRGKGGSCSEDGDSQEIGNGLQHLRLRRIMVLA